MKSKLTSSFPDKLWVFSGPNPMAWSWIPCWAGSEFNSCKMQQCFHLALSKIVIAPSMAICRFWPLCLSGIDACIYRDMLKWNKSSFLQKLVAAWMRILLAFLISDVSWVLANIMSEFSHCFWKGNRNSGRRLCIMVCPSFWEDYYMLIYTHCWELMNSVGSYGGFSLPFMMKVMVCHFVSNSHEVMTALIVVLPLIVVVEISLQLHQAICRFRVHPSDWWVVWSLPIYLLGFFSK